MSSSRSSSSSPEPEVVTKKSQKGKAKQKKVKIVNPAEEHGRNEGEDPNWDYKPPEGYALLKHKNEKGEFDWDAINNDDNLELWIVRVPDGLKPKHLEDVKLEIPSSSKTSRIGAIEKKSLAYDVWQLGEDEAEVVGGDELRTMSCLLPRHKKDGKLFQAPHPISRRLVISARPTLPTPPQSSPEASPVVHQNPPRPRHPPELLTHRFVPVGSLVDAEKEDVDMDAAEPEPEASHPRKSAKHEDKSKKKRKVDAESPKKKTKKAKTAS